ncbi:hypothetical protein [Bradyrhizobium macuxiense]|uniref:hypothetical protein n=1 Tax=Bradyrhizobium macuxiense TaxID=1755647 RepID=UPI0010A956C8|nr:hypothetical protein [Bradyrhizobium macuxiense]
MPPTDPAAPATPVPPRRRPPWTAARDNRLSFNPRLLIVRLREQGVFGNDRHRLGRTHEQASAQTCG